MGFAIPHATSAEYADIVFLNIGAKTKWSPCCRRLFHMHFNENAWISIKISLRFVPKGPINTIPALVQIMAWHRPVDNSLSKPICITRPQCVSLYQQLCALALTNLFSGRQISWKMGMTIWLRKYHCNCCYCSTGLPAPEIVIFSRGDVILAIFSVLAVPVL